MLYSITLFFSGSFLGYIFQGHRGNEWVKFREKRLRSCIKLDEKGIEGDGKRCHDYKMRKKKRLLDEYRFPGFRPKAEIKGIFGDSKARVIRLVRTQKNGVR
ncbi:MAG: hypothetical protein AYP45_16460 [Candidatus Brocadia carolinensis]|uniref:Uncharacterized protein n=1 Tax=Candidatus Brocadia carolinensis TaxID=1004156 RepID=A0A1V4APV1_9BACT|nr:MAG: hypothetical protein AYP45_16460 [Candidatus Brocadia caroliniensis]